MQEKFFKSQADPFQTTRPGAAATPSTYELYRELMQVAREIESCRASR